MKKKISSCILALIVTLTNVVNSYAFENPAIIEKRQGKYDIRLPEGAGSYVIDRLCTVGFGVINPYLGTGYVLMKSSYKSEINSTQLKNAKKATQDLITGQVKDKSLEYFSPKTLKPYVGKLTSFLDVTTTYSEVKKNLKNDTTDYALNIFINRKMAQFMSKSRLGSIVAYNYTKMAVKDLMKKGHIKVTLPKKWESTLNTKITVTNEGQKQINKIKRDKNKIISYFESKGIK